MKIKSRLTSSILTICLSIIIALSCVSSSYAKTYLVHPPGRGPAAPGHISGLARIDWPSLLPGDVILLSDEDGPYQENFRIAGKGSPQQPIIIKAAPDKKPIIEGTVFFTKAEHVIFEGITVTKSQYAGIIISDRSHHITVSHCTARNNLVGIWIGDGGGANNRIVGNEVYENAKHGIAVDKVNCSPGNETIISGNRVYANKYTGIPIQANYYIVEKNLVYGNGGGFPGCSGIQVYSKEPREDSGDHNIIRFNICYNNMDAINGPDGNGIQLDQWCDFNKVYYNICYNNDGAGISIFDSSDSVIYNNTLYNNLRDPGKSHPFKAEIYLTSDKTKNVNHVRNVRVENNIVVSQRPGIFAIMVDSLTANNPLSIKNNLFYHTQGQDFYFWNMGSGKDLATWNRLAPSGDNLLADPGFINPLPSQGQDFKLKSTSPAIDKATPMGQTRDALGGVVPLGKGPDLGAVESH